MFYENRGKLSIILILIGLGIFYLLPSTVAVFVGPLFFIMAMALWTLPGPISLDDAAVGSGPRKPDKRTSKLANVGLGIGFGLLAGLLFVFLPANLAVILIVVVLVGVVGYMAWLLRQ